MFSNVKNGWARFELGNFIGSCSYLTDPVIELGEALLHRNRLVNMDEEGSSFDIVISDYHVYIISNRNTTEFHQPYDGRNKENDVTLFAREFIKDITNDIEAWVDWFGYTDDDDIETLRTERRTQIEQLIENLNKEFN